jgi:hypothetical protein
VVESSALLKRRTPKGYRGFESLPHRILRFIIGKCSIGPQIVTNSKNTSKNMIADAVDIAVATAPRPWVRIADGSTARGTSPQR